jgi:hypothetical protein
MNKSASKRKKMDDKQPIENKYKYTIPKGTIFFRVETYAFQNPPYLFYAYFSGDFKEEFMANKTAWYSRCSSDKTQRIDVQFMRLTGIELLEISGCD